MHVYYVSYRLDTQLKEIEQHNGIRDRPTSNSTVYKELKYTYAVNQTQVLKEKNSRQGKRKMVPVKPKGKVCW